MTRTEITRRRALGVIGGTALVAATGFGCGDDDDDDKSSSGGGSSKGALKVGLVIPQSGIYATLGTDMKNGWDLWLAGHGGSIGGRKVETIVADEGETPTSGVPAVQSLLQRNCDVLVGIVNSAVALGSASMVNEAKKLLIVANAGANDITGKARSQYIWRTSFTNSQVSLPLGQYLADTPEFKSGAFAIAADYAAGNEAIAGFKKGYEGKGGKLAGQAGTPFGTTRDFQPYLSQIQRAGAKAIYCFYAGAEAVAFVQQYKQFGLAGSIPLFGSGFLTEGGALKAQGDAALGVRGSLHYSTKLDNPANTSFVKAYETKYGNPPTVYAVQTWDAAAVLDKAVRKADSLAGDKLAGALETVGTISDSPRGAWRFDGQTPKQTFYLREVKKEGAALVNAVIKDLGEFAQPTL